MLRPFMAANVASAADRLRSVADQLDPPGLSPAEREATRTGLRDVLIARLLRTQATMLEGQSALFGMLGCVLAVSMAGQCLTWLFLVWRTWP